MFCREPLPPLAKPLSLPTSNRPLSNKSPAGSKTAKPSALPASGHTEEPTSSSPVSTFFPASKPSFIAISVWHSHDRVSAILQGILLSLLQHRLQQLPWSQSELIERRGVLN